MKYFNKNSSSFHIMNGDKKLNIFKKNLWIIFNFINNNFFKKNFDTKLIKKQLKKILENNDSPSYKNSSFNALEINSNYK